MASISTDRNGNRTIQFRGTGRQRHSIRLGAVPLKTANAVKLKVEYLRSLASAKLPMDAETAQWVGGLGDDLAAKLAAVKLIPARAPSTDLTGLLSLYSAERERDNKPGTQTNHRTISNDLLGCFPPTTDLRSLTEADAVRFLGALRERKLAPATVARRVRRARTIFAFAVKKKLIAENPFQQVRAMSVLPINRKAYVNAADIRRVIAAANPTWRTIIALARFAGLRCPSEVLSLKWADIDFAAGRMTITSPKTERIPGKEYRVAPIFAALRPYLQEAFDLAGPGELYVVGGSQGQAYRETSHGPNGWVNTNLRSAFADLIRRAGLQVWPRLFHTLRASCETDLLDQSLPISAVTEWLGHSVAVALKHYVRVPDHQFERAATGGAESGASVVQNAVQPGADMIRQETKKPPEVLLVEDFRRLLSSPAGHWRDGEVTLRGSTTRLVTRSLMARYERCR